MTDNIGYSRNKSDDIKLGHIRDYVRIKNKEKFDGFVCKEWKHSKDFIEWAKDNGYKNGMHLLLIDKTKPYTPDNSYFSYDIEH